jgi:hypothetical protein
VVGSTIAVGVTAGAHAASMTAPPARMELFKNSRRLSFCIIFLLNILKELGKALNVGSLDSWMVRFFGAFVWDSFDVQSSEERASWKFI